MPDVEIGPLLEPPIPLGGPSVKHITTKVRLYDEFRYDDWAPQALAKLGLCLHSFPGPISFYRLAPPAASPYSWCEVYVDGDYCYREMHRNLRETWTEPADGVDLSAFKPRLRHPSCQEIRFDMVIRFNFEATNG